MNDRPENPRQSTLLSVMVILGITMIIGAIILIVWKKDEQRRKMAICGKNLGQIQGAIIAYTTDEGSFFSAESRAKIGSATNAHEARNITCRIVEILFVEYSLPNKLAHCPGSKYSNIKKKPLRAPSSPQWGMGPDGVVSYAMDWSTPIYPAAGRPVLADRDLEAHDGKVFVCFGDGHVGAMKLTAGSVRKYSALVTEGCDGISVKFGAMTGGGTGDDIYTSDGDGGEPLQFGKGDPLRAWVK